jgi:hypothetical protein
MIGNISSDYGACSNGTSFPNIGAGDDYNASSNPAGVAHGDRKRIHNSFQAFCDVGRMIDSDKANLRANDHVVTDGDECTVVDCKAIVMMRQQLRKNSRKVD